MKEISGAYEPKMVEDKIYRQWLASGFFAPEKLPDKRSKKFVVMIAPPNITGSLHMGHALENTIADILVRFRRMQGYKTLWLPGTDHAGIATQNVVEKDLKKQGLSRHQLGREKFLEKIWQWREQYGETILNQLKRLGCSLDWSRTRFTMDEKYQVAVRTAFAHYQKKGLIYQGERVINWCVKCQTALSDLELEYIEENSKLWHIKYPFKDGSGFVTVATTRPETMLGDTAVAINPKDGRYKNLSGKILMLPIMKREIPVVADFAVDKEFGTGAVKVTPAHDATDSAIAERAGLPYRKVINEVGKIINATPDFDGMKIVEAREKVIARLTELGLLEKEKEFTHNVAKCYRCNATVEPMLSKQWFVKMKPLAEKAIKAIEKGEITYTPARWKKISLDWLREVKDWCVSRQIWWGHKIPIADSEDTFDTWFSSALWPFAALGWPEKTNDLKNYYPTSIITSARDILHLWISRMVFSGLEFMGKPPFKDVIIHSTVQALDGRRMSKSLGTGIDPLNLIEKYGADATRFGLIFQEFGGQEIRFNEQNILMGKKFSNKLWNIARFVQLKIPHLGAQLPSKLVDWENKKFLKILAENKKAVEKNLDAYKFGEAAHLLYDFVWHEFADKFIENSKKRKDAETTAVLAHSLREILKTLHPFMPFITEEIWQLFGEKEMLLVEKW
ncbi:MAG: Valine-tRNA ligase [Parcubacteria group bacterium GW2011_GWB1_44_7]|nr:MAG: Valine-tRNA ligase [Parcubacteria group bacterium GW2011_GWB1_44_7]